MELVQEAGAGRSAQEPRDLSWRNPSESIRKLGRRLAHVGAGSEKRGGNTV